MVYVIIYKRNHKRVRVNNQLTPAFTYPNGAIKYIERRLNNSPYITIKKVGEH